MSSRSSERRDRRREWRGAGWDGHDWRGPGWHGGHWDDARNARSDDEPAWIGPSWAEPARRDVARRPTERRQGPVRIGDAERDQAVSLLSDHFVAGRLTQAEFEERSEEATKARYVDDLTPLFDDLPSPADLQVAQGPWSPQTAARARRRPPAFVMLAPFLMIGLVITAVTLTAPWLLWGMFWIMLISGAHRQRWQHQNRQNR